MLSIFQRLCVLKNIDQGLPDYIKVKPKSSNEISGLTQEHPFCSMDPTCPRHEDPERIHAEAKAVSRGELTPEEATGFVSGKRV